MKENVTESMFIDAFRDANREENFTYYGRTALYEYLTDLEDGCDFEIDFDVIGICCEFTQYASLKECLDEYDHIEDLEDLRDHTQVIEVTEHELIDGKFCNVEGGLIISTYF